MKLVNLFAVIIVFLSLTSSSLWEKKSYQLIIFEGSDWCLNCRRLEKQVLVDSSFQSFLDQQNIELVRVDFPQRIKQNRQQKMQNDSIAEKYDFKGVYPTILLVESNNQQYQELIYNDESMTDFTWKINSSLMNLK